MFFRVEVRSWKVFDLQVAIIHRSLCFSVQSLESDRTLSGKVFECFLEFVRCPVWVLAYLGPIVEIGIDDGLPVEEHRELGAFASDREVVPLPGWLGSFLARGHRIVKRSDHTVLATIGIFMDLDFERGERVLDVTGAKEDPAVGFGSDFELQVENEVSIRLLGPEGVVFLSDEFLSLESPSGGIHCIRKIYREKIFPARGVRMLCQERSRRKKSQAQYGDLIQYRDSFLNR